MNQLLVLSYILPKKLYGLPSAKLLHNYGKSPFSLGKSTISMAIFNSLLYVYQAGYRMKSPTKS
jgi:hypothetical protein